MKIWIYGCFLLFVSIHLIGQNKLEMDGQLSLIGSYSPDNKMDVFLGGRYIPKIGWQLPIDSIQTVDFEASANMYSSVFSHPFDSFQLDGNIRAYRLWGRYSTKQFELRLGLQKINFGSAVLLRPLQWFNQIDPRDPLQLTNGVYGLLGRYYFVNNINIWLWALYGNEKTKGLDVIPTNMKYPELGGRIQLPVSDGELALSFHHRTANSSQLGFVPAFEEIPENRIGLDGKWDLTVGLWFETAFIHTSKNIGQLSNRNLFNLGTDYTFSLGNGLHIIIEHLTSTFDEKALTLDNLANITAATITYPLSLFDNLSSILIYNWTADQFTFYLNYEHQFKVLSSYFMVYYNPTIQSGIQQNDLFNQFSGPGLRIMLIYNH